MVTGTVDNISPKALQLPKVTTTISGANYTIGISGATMVFWNGSVWKVVTTA